MNLRTKLRLSLAATALVVSTVIAPPATAQSVVNGNFETHFAVDCDFNNDNATFNALMPDVTAFGNGEEVDVQTFGCFVDPEEGDWCVAVGSNGNGFRDEIALRLSEPLEAGEWYRVSFSAYRQLNGVLGDRRLQIGLSATDDFFGLLLSAESLPAEAWERRSLSFVAPTAALGYITFRIETTSAMSNSWISIDDVSIGGPTIFSDGFESGDTRAW